MKCSLTRTSPRKDCTAPLFLRIILRVLFQGLESLSRELMAQKVNRWHQDMAFGDVDLDMIMSETIKQHFKWNQSSETVVVE